MKMGLGRVPLALLDPRMIETLINGDAGVGIAREHSTNQILARRAHVIPLTRIHLVVDRLTFMTLSLEFL